MALIKCSECGKQISDKANRCPNCGNKLNSINKKNIIIIISSICFILLIIICLEIYKSNNNNNAKEDYVEDTNDSYNDTEIIDSSYNVISIDGIGNSYRFNDFNECRVDDLKISIEETYDTNKLQVNYTITFTKTQKFIDDHDFLCQVKLSAYDDNNIVVGAHSALLDVGLNETGRTTYWFFIDKSGTDYSIKISEDS